MNFKTLQEEAARWSEKNFGKQLPYQLLLGVIEEVGELAHAQLKEEQQIRTNEDHVVEAKDAVGDIVIYLANYCTSQNFDLQTIVEETWAKVRQRDWKKNPEGDIDE